MVLFAESPSVPGALLFFFGRCLFSKKLSVEGMELLKDPVVKSWRCDQLSLDLVGSERNIDMSVVDKCRYVYIQLLYIIIIRLYKYIHI